MCMALSMCGGEEPEPAPEPAPAPEPEPAPEATGDYMMSLNPISAEVDAGTPVEVSAVVSQNWASISDLAGNGLRLEWRVDNSGERGDGLTDADVTDNDNNSGNSLTAVVTPHSGGTYYIAAQLMTASGTSILTEYVTLTVAPPPETAPEPVTAGIYVPFVTANEDFIRGTDVSSLLSVLNSGARFKDWDGNSLGETVEEQGANFMKLLADAGVNWVRLRVWNDPYDAQGHGYGGGNNDLDAAVTMGKWATDAGIRVLIDFHYSDFWADPAKQMVPKAWVGMDIDEKAQALSDFTAESLDTLLDAGVDVGMVQVGNETTTGICGESDWTNMGKLFAAGCDAVHDAGKAHGVEILAAIHFTNPEQGKFGQFATRLRDNGVSYDVFATSYYPEWHGTLDNLYAQLKLVADNFGVKVMVAETSSPWTYEDGDGAGGSTDPNGYPVSVQGQATEFSSIAKTVRSIGDAGLGLFYWENAWIPVRNISAITGPEWNATYAENMRLWEEFGSGWAASYAGEYDPEDAGKWYGGPVMDHKAMFDFDGKPLESLNVFKYMLTGTTGYVNDIVDVPELTVDAMLGEELTLPEKATAAYADTTSAELPVTWDEESVRGVDVNTLGKYTVTGKVSDGDKEAAVTCTVNVIKENYIVNGDFEQGDVGYTVSAGWLGKKITDKEPTNATSGTWVLHFWAESAFEDADATQTVKLAPGSYYFSLNGQGGSMGDSVVYAFVDAGGQEIQKPMALTEWGNIVNVVIEFTVDQETDVTLGVNVTAASGAWGAFDDWVLYKVD